MCALTSHSGMENRLDKQSKQNRILIIITAGGLLATLVLIYISLHL